MYKEGFIMYYCTIYLQLYGKLTPNSKFDLFLCLSYANKADAENCKQNLIKQAHPQRRHNLF